MKSTRRKFLGGALSLAGLTPVVGFPAVVKMRKPNELLSHACIGTGNMAWSDIRGLETHRDIHITALCDVDDNFLQRAKQRFPDARVYRDAFEMMAKEGAAIDSVSVSTPDHTHAQYVLEALRRGLNVYGQKPLCHELDDCWKIAKLAAQKQAITQMATQIMAWDCDRRTTAVLKQGLIGEVRHIWLFSTRRPEPTATDFTWPLKADPIPKTLDWKLWLGPAAMRPYSEKVYHPYQWRLWREFGSSWLGDIAMHLMSPLWTGIGLEQTSPVSVRAEISDDHWTPEQREQFWPTMSHVTWKFPGVKASGMKPFEMEWCDGFGCIAERIDPKFLPPAKLQEIAAKTHFGKLPKEGRVVEGSEGWLLSHHYGESPVIVMKNGAVAPAVPREQPRTTHYHEYIDSCLSGRPTTSDFAWTARLTETALFGNQAMFSPNTDLPCKSKF